MTTVAILGAAALAAAALIVVLIKRGPRDTPPEPPRWMPKDEVGGGDAKGR